LKKKQDIIDAGFNYVEIWESDWNLTDISGAPSGIESSSDSDVEPPLVD